MRRSLLRRSRSLFWRLFLANTLVLLAVFSFLAFTPATIESPARHPIAGLYSLLGLALVIAVNLVVMRRTLRPLSRLAQAMSEVDPLRPGQRVSVRASDDEIARLTSAFNAMLLRLEEEREESVRRILEAQDAERRAIARNLHDEIGQRLTALMLQLDGVAADAPEALVPLVEEARETARGTVEETSRLAKTLRPEVLEQLGLRSALVELTKRIASIADVEVERRLERELPPLPPDVELAVYRVAQESLTNVLRHADASRVELELARRNGTLTLRVADDGRGRAGASEGSGLRGIRERALMIGGRVELGRGALGGSEVRLEVPLGSAGEARGVPGAR